MHNIIVNKPGPKKYICSLSNLIYYWPVNCIAYNHLRNISNRYKHRDTQQVALLEERIEVRMCAVKELTETGTMVKMRTKPVKNIYVDINK